MAVAPGGGHFREMLLALEDIDLSDVLFVTNRLPNIFDGLNLKFEFITDPHLSTAKFAMNAFKALYLVARYRPRIVLSTGAGLSVPLFIIAKLLGARTIFIESGCRIRHPSRAGRILFRFADHFIVQSEALQLIYPQAIQARIL
jgi:beta-1,4-N-acetylglucosaminyltransferase